MARLTHLSRSISPRRPYASTKSIDIVRQPTRYSRFDDLDGCTMLQRQYRRAADHRLDHGDPKRLVPLDRKQHRPRAGQQSRLLFPRADDHGDSKRPTALVEHPTQPSTPYLISRSPAPSMAEYRALLQLQRVLQPRPRTIHLLRVSRAREGDADPHEGLPW